MGIVKFNTRNQGSMFKKIVTVVKYEQRHFKHISIGNN